MSGGEILSICVWTFFSDREQPVYANTPAANLTVNNDAGLPSAVVTWTEPIVKDNSGLFTVAVSHPSGSAFGIGITTVIYTAVDSSGNIASFAFNVTVTGMIFIVSTLFVIYNPKRTLSVQMDIYHTFKNYLQRVVSSKCAFSLPKMSTFT